MKKGIALILSFFTATFVLPQSALAVGSGAFENASFSARSLGQGNAVVAQGDEPAAISYNPAAIVDLPGIQAQTNHGLISLFSYSNSSTRSDNRSSGTIHWIPTGYLTINPGSILNERLAIGVGSDSPFGLANKYDSQFSAARFTGHVNWLKMFTIKPVAAVKVTDWLSIGAGPVWYRVFDAGQISQYPNSFFGLPNPDGQMRIDLSGNRWGWQMGAKITPHEKHHFGFYFRSPVTIKLKGKIDVENSGLSGNFTTGAKAKMNLPFNMTFGYAFHPSRKTTFEVDFGYTRWSHYKRVTVHNDPTGNPFDDALVGALGDLQGDFRNGYSLHLGANHKVNEKLSLRAGSYFYWTPVPKTHFRPAVPDSNSIAVTLGLSYEVIKNLTFDVAYMSRFWLKRRIDNDLSEVLGTTVDGTYFSWGQEAIFSLTYLWDPFPHEYETDDIPMDVSNYEGELDVLFPSER